MSVFWRGFRETFVGHTLVRPDVRIPTLLVCAPVADRRGAITRMLRCAVAASSIAIALLGCTSASSVDGNRGRPIAATGASEIAASPTALGDIDDAAVTPDQAAVAASLAIAAEAMTNFCRPDLDQKTWVEGLYPYLTQAAGVSYRTVDPANVTCTSVTGIGQVCNGDGAFTMRVLVPTDAGEYSVTVHRAQLHDLWAVNDMTPIAGQ